MMTNRLKVGLIGCGDFGVQLGRYIMELTDIVVLCDLEAERCIKTAQLLNLAPEIYTDYRNMLVSEKLDAVFITAVNFAHADITIAAANAGLHVFCEKVMAPTVPECWAMVRACQAAKVKLMVGHKRRLRPPWARMIELTRDDGILGTPLSISIVQYADVRPYNFANTWWDDTVLSGGLFSFHCPHVLDWFIAMCGEANRVWGMYGPQQDENYRCPDIATAVVEFKNGAIATVATSLAFPLHKYRESQGPIGQTRNGGFKLIPQMNYIDLYWKELDNTQLYHERFDDLGFDYAYRLEVSDFVHWITHDKTPCLTWTEGLRCVELMEAINHSADSGGTPVDLPLYPQLEHK